MNDLVQPLSGLTPQAVSWLWPNNLSFGNLAIFDGDPGLGKSLVALDLCARLSTGRPFPGSDWPMEPAASIILNGEDGPLDALLPRLACLGADLSKIHVLRRDFLDKNGSFRLPNDTRVLEQALADTGARLIVIDPIMAFLDKSVSIASDQSVRSALSPLADLAVQYRCVPLMIRHLNKMLGGSSLYRGGGSIAFQGACRASWLFCRDPLNKDGCVMAQVKNNYAPLQPALAFAVRGQGAALTLEWLGTSKLSANQLLAAARKPAQAGRIFLAGEFLRTFLKQGPRLTTDIWPAAEEYGFPQRTLRAARRKANIKFRRCWTHNKLLTYWYLEGQKLPEGAASPTVSDVKNLLKPIIEQYPTTPIDDV